MGARQDLAHRPLLDTSGMAGVPIELAVGQLAARQPHLLRIDHDDEIATVDMGRIAPLVLAPQSHGDDRGKPAEHQPVGIDEMPAPGDVGRFQGLGLHDLR